MARRSQTRQPPGNLAQFNKDFDAGEQQPREGAVAGGLKVFGQAAIAIEPSEGALDDAAPARQSIAVRCIDPPGTPALPLRFGKTYTNVTQFTGIDTVRSLR